MEVLVAIVTGVLFGCAAYMLASRSMLKIVLGLALLSHAANLLVFSAAGLVRGKAPIVAEGASQPPPGTADPLPQALVLTAVVIGFGLLAFAIVLVHRLHRAFCTDDVVDMEEAE